MFFFFFDDLIYQTKVGEAFEKICTKKMLLDGYINMSVYIQAKINKPEMLSLLEKAESRFSVLYSSSFPKKENVFSFWQKQFGQMSVFDYDELSMLEAHAIVYWIYKILPNYNDRIQFTMEIFRNIKDFYSIKNSIEFSDDVFYDKEKVELYFIKSISEFDNFISHHSVNETQQLFYRGHSDANYILAPSIMRNNKWFNNESAMYNDIIINCPESFSKCNTHLEKLVEMQHYGLPTRLLDITRNPLVALYFACESNYDNYGEVVLIAAEKKDIKYPQSDSVSVLSSLPLFSRKNQEHIRDCALSSENNYEFNKKIPRLHHEIRLEKPAFLPEIIKEEIIDSFIVYAVKNNNRIVKQDGAFIICGLIENSDVLNKYRLKEDEKKVVLLIDNKEQILKTLDNLSINKATLFPEIECVTEYIKSKYL